MSSTRLTSLVEDVEFDATELANQYDNNCQWLVALTDWQISVILSALRFAEWRSRWRNLGEQTWNAIEAEISRLEYCLMAGCNVENLIKTNLMMIAAMTGQAIDLDDIDDNFFTGEKDYTAKGLANRIGPEATHLDGSSISARIEDVNDVFIYDDKNIAQIVSELTSEIGGQGNRITLKEFFDAFEGDDKVQYAPIYGLLGVLSDILPTSMQERYLIEDPAQFTFNVVDGFLSTTTQVVQAAIEGVSTAVESGEAAVDVTISVLEILNTVFEGVSAGALSLQTIIDLMNLYKGGQTPPADTNPALRNITRVFVEGDAINMNCAPDVTVNCGGSGGGGGMGTPGDGGLGGTFEPIIVDPDEEFPIDQDKCNRVTYIADKFIVHIQNVAGIATITDLGFAVGSGFFLNATPLVFTSLAIAGTAVLLAYVVIGAIIGGIVGSVVMLAWASALEDAKEDFICAAYNASTASGFISAVRDWIEATIPTIGISWTDKYVEFVSGGGVAAWVLTGEGFTPPEELPVGDCEVCGGLVWTPQPGYGYYCHIDHQNAEECVVHSVQGARFGNPAVPTQEVIVSPSEACTIHVEWTGNPNCWHWDAQQQPLLDIYANPPPEEIEMVAGNWLAFLDLDRNPPAYFEVTITYV